MLRGRIERDIETYREREKERPDMTTKVRKPNTGMASKEREKKVSKLGKGGRDRERERRP